ncbi:MAG: hypothetical protein H6605_06025 [Flavobacteriales bacterium]|nr:hypothetical protein [Flavobacteriales bacterium]
MTTSTFAQKRKATELSGQFSAIGSYSPKQDLNTFIGARYIPQLNHYRAIDTSRKVDLEASLNLSGSVLSHPFTEFSNEGKIAPYRLWLRYSGKQFELRAGLQKIDFGAATLLRPIQWFNQIDPRDPLQLTNGVYGLLGRYYFINNSNIWIWSLYGNKKTRGLDLVETNSGIPEYGLRYQFPVTRGEIGLSYHRRIADATSLFGVPNMDFIPENRYGLDAKWDYTIGIWLEASYVQKKKNIGSFTHQTLANLGGDYTFGIANGLHLMIENLFFASDEKAFNFESQFVVSALALRYPLTLFDNLQALVYYPWNNSNAVYLINLQHDFKKMTSYLMAYYNPDSFSGLQQNNLTNQFAGPGFRIMLVYNH